MSAYSPPKTKGRAKRAGLPLLLSLFIVCCASIFFATASGAVAVPISVVARILLNPLPFINFTGGDPTQEIIIMAIRLPRVLLAALIGGGLGMAGAALQALFRNPMADPGIIGISSGGALAAVVAMASGLSAEHTLAFPIATFLGALTTLLLVYGISGVNSIGAVRGRTTSAATLLLSGIAVGVFMGAVLSLILTRLNSSAALREIFFWLMGGLDGRGWDHLKAALGPMLVGCIGLLFFSRDLNLLLLEGEEGAQALGMEIQFVQRSLMILSALIIGAAVAASGTVAFVGLIVPHIVRLIIGPNHLRLLPATFLAGAILLVAADLAARTLVAPEELRLGTITSLIGVPFFLYLLRKNRKRSFF